MLIIPAIDLKDHRVVRLRQGKLADETVYSHEPIEVAKRWIDAGATRLHIVDLNGAFEGKPMHFDEIEKIARLDGIEIEVGGGIRTLKTLNDYFNCGVAYAILGSAVIDDADFVNTACDSYPHQIILGIDAKDGIVMTRGWDQNSAVNALDAIGRFSKNKISAVIYTDIARDGMLKGINFDRLREIKDCGFPVIASGGFSSRADLDELSKMDFVCGVIAGKVIYEGTLNLKEAIVYLNQLEGRVC